MHRPSFIPIPTVFSIVLFIATITTDVFTSLLLLFYYCYFHKTVATDKLLRARLLSGAAELTTHLLRLISILWLPLCRINKLGFTTLEDRGDPIYLWVIRQRRLLVVNHLTAITILSQNHPQQGKKVRPPGSENAA